MMELYHNKSHKKAMKIAETLLSRHPNHGETLSVKALLMLCLEPTREDEIVEVAKRGLRNGINSYLCWYSLGVVYRHIKRYKDAVKCFVMAFKLDPHNDRLLREICCLEIELNDYSGFRKYASVQLKLKSKEYREWVIFAFSQHLCGNLAISCEILEEADKLFMGSYRVDDLELSESIMYRAMLYEHLGEFNKCTELLTTKSYQLKDKVTYLELLAKCYYFGNHPTEAHETYKKLIQMCPGNVRFVLLYFLTHPNVKIRALFHFSHCYTKPLRGSIYQEKLLTDAQIFTESEKLITESEKLTEGKKLTDAQKLTHGENPIEGKNLSESEKLNPISDDTPDETCVYMLSDEIFDLDGEYSSGGWMLESKLHHSFDRYVRRMNMCNNVTYRNSHTFPQFMYKVVKNLDLRSLPTPDKILSVDELIKVINCYLDPTPLANCVPYCKYRKFLKRDSYPLVFQLRQLSQYEELLLLEQLDAMNLKDRFVFAMLEFLFSSDEIFHARAEKYIKQSIRDGKVNILKSFTHALTFKKAYILLYLTHNLCKPVDTVNGEERISHNYQKVLVTLLLAQLYDYLGAYSTALQVVNEGFRITNTSPDLLCLRGKINRHLGDLRSSCEDYCVAGDLDRSDRQTSAKCAKAILRTNEFSLAQKKWKSFLTEDVCHRNDKDTPPEIPSFKFLLLQATLLYQLHQHYILDTIFKGNHKDSDVPVTPDNRMTQFDSVTAGDSVTETPCDRWLKESFGVYKNVLERHMEIYVNQLDFHNYCLNRLSYRVYYNFLKLRNQHCNQGYFIKALKGLIRTALELFHSTTTTGDDDNNNCVVYCVNKMRMVLCQRVFDAGLYHLFYELAEMRGMSVLFKLQCIMRCYYSARCDKYNPHLTQLIHHFLSHNTKFTHFEATLVNKMLRICSPNNFTRANHTVEITVENTVECSVVEDYVNNVLEYVLSERYEYKGVMALVFMGYNYREKSFLELLFLNANSLYEGINFRDFLKVKKLLSKAIYTCNNLNNQLFLKLQLEQLITLFPNQLLYPQSNL
uniref:Uncharacterized protein n=2 Tax=Theileria parva TaxID=5875 RepID=Q4N6I6_THEPA|eukprot:XP_766705.1 hypothetical protein [Theileria parva strain Muguga]